MCRPSLDARFKTKPNKNKWKQNKKTEKTIKDIYGTIGGNSNVDWVLDDIIYVN